jgi:hypothetical protein
VQKIQPTQSSKPRRKTRTQILRTVPVKTLRSQKNISRPKKIQEQRKETKKTKTRTQPTNKSGVCQIRSPKSGTASVRESTPKKRSTSLPHILTSILALSLSGTLTSTGLWPLALPAQNKKPKFYAPLPLRAPSASTRLTNSWKHTQNYKVQSGVTSKRVGCISWDFTNTPWPGSISSKDYKETAEAHALAQIEQARVRPLLGRGAISAEAFRIYLPAQTRAQVSAAAFRQPGHSNTGRGHTPTTGSSSSKTKKTTKNKSTSSNPRSNGLRPLLARCCPRQNLGENRRISSSHQNDQVWSFMALDISEIAYRRSAEERKIVFMVTW